MEQTTATEPVKRVLVSPRPMEAKDIGFETRRGELGNITLATFSGWASTEDEDLYEDVVRASGWGKELGDYKKNPVLLWLHTSHYLIGGVPSLQVVKNEGLYVNRGEVVVNRFVEEFLLPLLEARYLRAMSVGFLPRESRPRDPEDDSYWAPREFLQQRLLEISLVPMPANPAALVDLSKALTEADDTKVRAALAQDLEADEARALKHWFTPIETPPQFTCPDCIGDLYREKGLVFQGQADLTPDPLPEAPVADPEPQTGAPWVREAGTMRFYHAHNHEHLEPVSLDAHGTGLFEAAHLVGPREGEDPALASSYRLTVGGVDHGEVALDRHLVGLQVARVLSKRDGLTDEERDLLFPALPKAYEACGLEWPTDGDGQPAGLDTPFKDLQFSNGEDISLREWVALSTLRGLRDGLRGLARLNWQAPEAAREDVEETRALLAGCLGKDNGEEGTNPEAPEPAQDVIRQTLEAIVAEGLTEDEAKALVANLEKSGTNPADLGPEAAALLARLVASELHCEEG